jgi:16S rRNA (guanine1207-N2)-methyltransferase
MSDLASFLYAHDASVSGERVLLLNAKSLPELKDFQSSLMLHQDFKPDADALAALGHEFTPSLDDGGEVYGHVLLIGRKHKDEMKALIAHGVKSLKPDGTISVCAYNNEGGTRLAGYLKEIGCADIQSLPKHKGRVVSAKKGDAINHDVLKSWALGGDVQDILGGEYRSQPGIFGWNKIDSGSEILMRYVPDGLKGRVADLGCGYGYLAQSLLDKNPKIKSLMACDADYRAVQLCAANTKDHEGRIDSKWHDLSKPLNAKTDRAFMNFDSVVMNPPFHTGKSTDSDLGLAFIRNAYTALRARGSLFMVANAHLPYEDVLSKLFFRVQRLHEGGGFKVYRADK